MRPRSTKNQLSIPTKWRVSWLLFVLLVCATVFRFSFIEKLADTKQPFEVRQNAIIDKAALLINTRLSLVETQIRLFKHELTLLNPSANQLESAMRSIFTLYRDSLQVRWIDLQGAEQVRLNKTEDNRVVAVPTGQLQNKYQRYYTQAGLALDNDSVFISQIDLNVEQGIVQRPFQPTLRAVIKTQLPSKGEGLLVINFDLRSLLAQVSSLNEENIQLLISAGAKRWVVHPNKDNEWRIDLKKAPSNISTDLPDLLALLKEVNIAQGVEIDNQLYTAQSIKSHYERKGSLPDIYVVSRTAPSVLPTLKKSAMLYAVLVAIATGLGGFVIYVSYSRYLKSINSLNEELARQRDNLQSSLERQSALIDELAESKKLSSLSIMVAGLAHELNTPVGATQLALSNQRALLEKLVKNKKEGLTKSAFEHYIEQTQQSLHQAQHNNQRAIELVYSFKRLTFERANNEQMHFSVKQHLNDLCKSMKGLLHKNNIYLKVHVHEELSLFGFAGAFSQIVQIILSNAIDHAFDGMAGARIELIGEQRNNDIVVRVIDNGKGIKPEELPRIFDPFFTTKRQESHTGLGLHMAKIWIEQAFNGEIRVDSTEGRGTSFELKFRSIEQGFCPLPSSKTELI